jgi:hypothetical protein
MIDLEFEIAVALRQRVQDLDTRGNDFSADPVARDGCYGVRLHRSSPDCEWLFDCDG